MSTSERQAVQACIWIVSCWRSLGKKPFSEWTLGMPLRDEAGEPEFLPLQASQLLLSLYLAPRVRQSRGRGPDLGTPLPYGGPGLVRWFLKRGSFLRHCTHILHRYTRKQNSHTRIIKINLREKLHLLSIPLETHCTRVC